MFRYQACETKINVSIAHRGLYTTIVVGDALHVGGILPVGEALFIQGAAAQNEPCESTYGTHITNGRLILQPASQALSCELTHGVGRAAHGSCVPRWSHLPHHVGEVVLAAYFMRFCWQRESRSNV